MSKANIAFFPLSIFSDPLFIVLKIVYQLIAKGTSKRVLKWCVQKNEIFADIAHVT